MVTAKGYGIIGGAHVVVPIDDDHRLTVSTLSLLYEIWLLPRQVSTVVPMNRYVQCGSKMYHILYEQLLQRRMVTYTLRQNFTNAIGGTPRDNRIVNDQNDLILNHADRMEQIYNEWLRRNSQTHHFVHRANRYSYIRNNTLMFQPDTVLRMWVSQPPLCGFASRDECSSRIWDFIRRFIGHLTVVEEQAQVQFRNALPQAPNQNARNVLLTFVASSMRYRELHDDMRVYSFNSPLPVVKRTNGMFYGGNYRLCCVDDLVKGDTCFTTRIVSTSMSSIPSAQILQLPGVRHAISMQCTLYVIVLSKRGFFQSITWKEATITSLSVKLCFHRSHA
jgi:hypothetical protein